MTGFCALREPHCPLERAAADMFRILQNLVESHPEELPALSRQADHDLREARATVERLKDQLLTHTHQLDQFTEGETYAN